MAALTFTEAALQESKIAVRHSSRTLETKKTAFFGDSLSCGKLNATFKVSEGNIQYGKRPLVVEAAKKISTGRSYVLTSTLVATEGKEEAVLALCKEILKWGDERKKDKKNGVINFECNVDAYEKNVFHFWERYDGFLSMNDTRASKEHCKFMDDVRPLLASPVALAAYEYKDGKIGCMLNPIGPKGEGGLDDATGQGGSGGGASYQQTSAGVQQGINEVPKDSKKVWGLQRALKLSAKRLLGEEVDDVSSDEEEISVAQRIADGLASLFGQTKKKK